MPFALKPPGAIYASELDEEEELMLRRDQPRPSQKMVNWETLLQEPRKLEREMSQYQFPAFGKGEICIHRVQYSEYIPDAFKLGEKDFIWQDTIKPSFRFPYALSAGILQCIPYAKMKLSSESPFSLALLLHSHKYTQGNGCMTRGAWRAQKVPQSVTLGCRFCTILRKCTTK